MHLFLLRHGKAENSNPGGDGSRALVEKGREQARRAGCLLKTADLLPDIVLTSPLVRARQTADEFCQAGGISEPVVQTWLASGMGPETALAELAAFREFPRVAIVGHEPDLSKLIEWLLGCSTGSIEIRKGTIAGIEIAPPARRGQLIFLIPPKLAYHPDE
jgi:phosphohistidine phosphatase